MTPPAGTPHEARLIVQAGPRRFAIPAQAVREIVPVPRLTRVPLAPPAMRGLGKVRGETLAVLSLAELMRAKRTSADERGEGQLLVLDGAVRAGVLVDRIERLERSHMRAPAAAGDDENPIAMLEIGDLIAEAIPARPASRRAAATRQAAGPEIHGERLGLLRLGLGGQHFALPLDQVAEVLRPADAVAVLPGADEAVVGSVAWRDTTLAVMSLTVLLGLPVLAAAAQRIVVVRIGQHHLGLTVDTVDAVLRAAPERIDPVPPALLRGDSEARVAAIYRPDDMGRLVSILSADKLLGADQTRRLLTGTGPGARMPLQRAVPSIDRIAVLAVMFGAERMAVPIASIRQVQPRPSRMTRVPGAPDWFSGLAVVGGAPLPVIDQVLRLTGTPSQGPRQRLLVIEVEGTKLGFLVTATAGIVHGDGASLAPAPLPDALADGIMAQTLAVAGSGANEDRDAPLLVIDPAALVSSIERSMIERISLAAKAGEA